jgi:7,8-dihydropterin-6-yl-methyl-4-(beta-D-ribofuranosyl)aminobenzene 5'-phosphate synthase
MKSTRRFGFWLMALAGVVVVSSSFSARPSPGSITVVCDHDEAPSKAERSSKIGLSTLVRFQGAAILSDIGGESCALEKSLDELGFDATSIDAIVLSRNSPDYVRASAGVLKSAAQPPKVYVPAPAPGDMKQRVPRYEIVAVSKPTSIVPNAWIMGPLEWKHGSRKTAGQVLVLHQPDGLVVNVGCSHPGVVSVVQRVREAFGYRKIKILAGGIHLQGRSKSEVKEISLRLQQMGVEGLALSHCTGRRALKVFRAEWGDRMVSFDRGDTIDF